MRRDPSALNGWVDLVDAAKLIPCKQGTLRVFLHRHPEYGRVYRRGRHRKKIRQLRESWIVEIRKIMRPVGLPRDLVK